MNRADLNCLAFALLRAVEREMETNPEFRAQVEELERQNRAECADGE